MSMLLVLPASTAGVEQLEAKLSTQKLTEWQKALSSKEVEVSLPRFEVAPEPVALNDALRALGMKSAFEPSANFTGIVKSEASRDGLKLDTVVHKAFVRVDETGTEAAAATAALGSTTGVPPRPEVFRADHPFLYAIVDNASGLLLFLGRMTDPSQRF